MYKLVLGANRDEFYKRKTAAAAYWPDHPQIIGGRDMEANGTWMAMTRQGRIAMVTNYRDLKHIKAKAPSRGKLVSDYLINTDLSPLAYLKTVEPYASEYNGFNLLVGNADEFFYLSNYASGIQEVGAGLHGLSNHLLETSWPKVSRGKEKLSDLLQSEKLNPDQLLNVLYDDLRAPENRLPSTGLPLDREKALSSMFIKTPDYGTRCSTVILITRNNEVSYVERRYDPEDFAFETNAFEFKF